MKPERWHEIERLYHLARKREPQERAAFLEKACAGNESLRKEVESLLACRPKAENFMESSAREAAVRILAEDIPAELSRDDAARIHEPTGHAGLRRDKQRVFPPWWMLLLSVPFVACAGFLYFRILFGPEPVGWSLQPSGRAGSETFYLVTSVRPQSAAAHAGFQTGDLILAKDLDQFLTHSYATDQYQFQVERHSEGRGLTLTLKRKGRDYWVRYEGVRALLLGVTSVLYLVLAGILVVARPQDTQARWGALLLAQLGIPILALAQGSNYSLGFIESAHALRTLPVLLGVAILVGMSISVTFPAGAFGFLAGFPQTPFTLRRAWSLIWAPAMVVTIPINLNMFWLPVYAGANGPVVPAWLIVPGWVLGASYLAASIILLMRNYHRIEGRNERRRLRMVVAGFGVTVFAMAVAMVFGIPWGPIERFRSAYFAGFDSVRPLLLAAAPICTTYAILRHRMFDIHLMVRLGLRYAAARGLLLSIVPAIGLMLVLDLLNNGNQPLTEITRRRGLLYMTIALGAFLLHARQKVWLNALDRRFFRDQYDAQQILSAVVDNIRRAGTFDRAASHVVSQIQGALHPEFASLMVREPGAAAYRATASTGGVPPPIPAHSKLIALMRLLDKPLENSQSQPGWLRQQLPHEEAEYLQRARVEWLFPVMLGETGADAILVLGPKRSEEPYSREDRDLLRAITGSLALLLERPSAPATASVGFAECPECGTCYDSGLALCETDGAKLSLFPYSRCLAQRYWFERRLGRGGMGSVYQARDRELDRGVAVKVIRSDRMGDTEAVARFRREAKAAAGFSHPNVVTIHDFGVAEDNRAYLVMELLSGRSLREELLQCKRLESKRVLEILSGVGSAVAAAHERMLLHRDLKPENIFLSRSGEMEVAKILDFGLAKMITPAGVMESLPGTAPGMLIGTLAYMSPEQIRGGAPMESWDLWSLAVVAFEMLTGVHPFGTLTDWRRVLTEGHFPPPDANAPALTTSLKEFFECTLDVDRSRRPGSARQFIVGLQAALCA